MKATKRFILTLVAILGMTGAWAQDADEVAVTKTANNNEWTLTMPASDVELQVEYNATTLEIGQTLQLTAEPADKGLVWNSSNEQVATVSADGQVTAAGLGEAIITVYPQEYEHVGNGNYVVVTVVDSSIPFVDD